MKLRQGKIESATTLAAQSSTSFERAEVAAQAPTLAGLVLEQLRRTAAEVRDVEPARLSPKRAVEAVLGPLARAVDSTRS